MLELIRFKEKDVPQFVKLCQKAFPTHNVFYRTAQEVADYLRSKDEQNKEFGGVFFAYEGGKLVGGALLRKEDFDPKGKHVRLKYNHLVAVNDKVKKKILEEFNQKVSKMIKEGKINTAKLELGLAENETDIQFYLDNGFVKEGKLKSHYRFNETVYVLGMEITK